MAARGVRERKQREKNQILMEEELQPEKEDKDIESRWKNNMIPYKKN